MIVADGQDVLLAGPPSPLLDRVAEGVLERDPALLHTQVGAEEAWTPAPGGARRLLRAAFLPYGFATAVREGRLRGAMVLDTPDACLAALHREGRDPEDALRALSACVTPLGELADVLEAVVAPDGAVADPILAAAIAPAFRHATTGARVPLAWPAACLFSGDQPGEKAPRVLRLTGPARVLAYGPYYHLPAGAWQAEAMLAFSAACAGAPLAVELHGGGELLGRGRFRVAHAGVFAARFAVTVRSSRTPLEMRLVSERGAIEGEMGFDRIAFTPAGREDGRRPQAQGGMA